VLYSWGKLGSGFEGGSVSVGDRLNSLIRGGSEPKQGGGGTGSGGGEDGSKRLASALMRSVIFEELWGKILRYNAASAKENAAAASDSDNDEDNGNKSPKDPKDENEKKEGQQNAKESSAGGGSGGGGGWENKEAVESVKLLILPKRRVLERIKRYLRKYIVRHATSAAVRESEGGIESAEREEQEKREQEEDIAKMLRMVERERSRKGKDEAEGAQYDVSTEIISTVTSVRMALFLPPMYHLLMKFRIGANSTIVRMRTDQCRLLEHVDAFFDNMFVVSDSSAEQYA